MSLVGLPASDGRLARTSYSQHHPGRQLKAETRPLSSSYQVAKAGNRKLSRWTDSDPKRTASRFRLSTTVAARREISMLAKMFWRLGNIIPASAIIS